MNARSVLALGVLLGVVLGSARPAAAARGGPDAGGYVWADSQEPGVSWRPAVFTGPTTAIGLTDESVKTITLPFPFSFYGLPATSTVWVSDNGWLAFANPSGPAPINAGIPDAAPPDGMAAFYWDDLDPTGGTATHGPIAGGYGILIWATAKVDGSPARVMVELYPDGRLRFAWIAGLPANVTIGLEDETGTKGTELVRDGVQAPGFQFSTSYAVAFWPPSRIPCATAPVQACGSTASYDTAAGTSLASGYSCSPGAFDGREIVVAVDLASTSSLTATISGFGTRALSVFLLPACQVASCLSGGGTSASAAALLPGRYVVVVDGLTAADDGAFDLKIDCAPPTIAVHSGWYTNPGEALIPASPPFAVRGDPAEFASSSFPPRGDPAWTPTPDPNFASFDIPSTNCGNSCGATLEFTYFRTCLWLPVSFTELIVRAAHVDDGIAVRVNGSLVSTGTLGAYQSPDLAGNPALVPGALNDIEVIHVDDCCARSVLRDLTFTVDGQNATAAWVDHCDVQAAVAPVGGPVCPGTPVLLDASPSSSAVCTAPLEFRWRQGTTVLSPFSAISGVMTAPDQTTTYTVDVLCPNGCGCQASSDVVVQVSPGLTFDVPATVSICAADGAVMGGNPTAGGGTPPLRYSWTPTSDLDDPASANPRATPPATTTYRLEVTDGLGCKASRDETVVLVGAVPASVGDTLLGVRAGPDALWSWASLVDATSYHLRTDLLKLFGASVLLGNSVATTYTHANAVLLPPSLRFYRVRGVGCGGEGL